MIKNTEARIRMGEALNTAGESVIEGWIFAVRFSLGKVGAP
jgi:hypothetical protein